MTTRAYLEGAKDKRAVILEPTPTFEPGTKNYLEYVLGYLRAQYVAHNGKRSGGLDV